MNEYYTTSSGYYLVHSGVLGMKWGIGTSTINPLLGVGLIAATSGLSALATRAGTHGHYYNKQAKANAPVNSK